MVGERGAPPTNWQRSKSRRGRKGWTIEIELGRRPSLDPYSRRGGGAQAKKKKAQGQSEKTFLVLVSHPPQSGSFPLLTAPSGEIRRLHLHNPGRWELWEGARVKEDTN